MFQEASLRVPAVPSFFCGQYCTLTVAKEKLTDSAGVSSPPELPDHWMLSTQTSVKAYCRETRDAFPPAVRITTTAGCYSRRMHERVKRPWPAMSARVLSC